MPPVAAVPMVQSTPTEKHVADLLAEQPPAQPKTKPTPFAAQPGQKLRTEGEVAPDTWGEYAAWKLTKRMKPRDRRVTMIFGVVDFDQTDELDEAIHQAMASTAALSESIMSSDPMDLLNPQNKKLVAGAIGAILFSATTICDLLSENWGLGQLIVGNHFAATGDLTSIHEFHERVVGTIGSPTEIVVQWKHKALYTATALMIAIGDLSRSFRKFRWDAEGINVEAEATKFMESMSCVEALAAFFGLTLTQCLLVNQAHLNEEYPQGWRPAGQQPG